MIKQSTATKLLDTTTGEWLLVKLIAIDEGRDPVVEVDFYDPSGTELTSMCLTYEQAKALADLFLEL